MVVGPAECEAVDLHVQFREGFDGAAYIDSITTKAVELGDDEDVSRLQRIQQPEKPRRCAMAVLREIVQ